MTTLRKCTSLYECDPMLTLLPLNCQRILQNKLKYLVLDYSEFSSYKVIYYITSLSYANQLAYSAKALIKWLDFFFTKQL